MKFNDDISSIMLVRMTCLDKDGKLQDSGPYKMPLRMQGLGKLRLGIFLLFLGIAIATMFMQPEWTLMVPLLGRVTTAGLNKLLDATLKTGLTTPTWYVGLMKYVSATGVTNGTTTFTDTNGTWVSGDVTRNILIKAAGAAGADLLTTISAVGSTTSITLGVAATSTSNNVQYAFECRAADTMASHTSFTESTAYSNANRVTWTPGTISGGSVDNSASPATFNMNATDWIFGAFLVDNNTKGGTTGTLYGAGVNSGGVVIAATNGATINVTVTPSVTAT